MAKEVGGPCEIIFLKQAMLAFSFGFESVLGTYGCWVLYALSLQLVYFKGQSSGYLASAFSREVRSSKTPKLSAQLSGLRDLSQHFECFDWMIFR